MLRFIYDFLTWVLAFVALGIALGWGVHLLDRSNETPVERGIYHAPPGP